MRPYGKQLLVFAKRLAWVFAAYTLSRVLFYLLNRNYFQGMEAGELLSVCFYGLRFDTFSICVSNSLFILLSLLPAAFVRARPYQRVLFWAYILPNSLALLLNFIDFAYFPFTQKRTTYDVFGMAFGGQSEMGKLIPLFLKDYWYVVLLYILTVWGLVNRYRRIDYSCDMPFRYTTGKSMLYLLIFGSVVAGTVLGIRGGLQRVPISIVDGGKFTKPQYVPILLNTPFSIIKSAELKTISELNLMPEAEALRYINPVHPADTGGFKPKNVCVIILESFSKEFTGISNRRSYTPFLDSLMGQSLLYTNAYANGKKSIEGIPSILASMPSLMEDPYLNSYYSTNVLQALPGLLKEKGYQTAFFHGGTNGTMNFDAFSRIAGFEHYYGRTEYANDADYDGQWGIWDVPFLKYTAKKIGEFKEPFLVSFFTLSSHHPYKVPKGYENRFPKGTLEIHESLGYADHALRCFFEEAKKQAWYANTVFVITPDHTGISEDRFYANIRGQYSIPLAFFTPDHSLQGRSDAVVQQIDIMPAVLDHLHYDQPYFSFGSSLSKKHPAIYYSNGNYYLAQDSLFYVINDFKVSEVYSTRDSMMQNTLLHRYPQLERDAENYTKAFIQTYNNRIIRNKTQP